MELYPAIDVRGGRVARARTDAVPLAAARAAGLAGAVVGRALHEGRFTAAEAVACRAA